MARRADALIPLSWDHHHGLNLARTIVATLEGDERFGNPSPAEMQAMVAARWSAELRGHFADEEALLGPLADEDDGLAELLDRMRREHGLIGELVDAVGAARADTDELADVLWRFAEALQEHVRFEERELFPAVESHLGAAEQRALGEALVQRRLDDGRGSERELEAVRGELLP